MLFSLFLVCAGLTTPYLGGEGLVRGSVSISRGLGLPKLVIGLLIVGFGTSMPEMLVSIQAMLDGSAEIALGNVVGSNIANVLLIVGIAAVLMPISHWNIYANRGAIFVVAVSILLYLLSYGEMLDYFDGLLMLGLLAVYLITSYFVLARNPEATSDDTDDQDFFDALIDRHVVFAGIAAVAGIVLLMLGADMLITGAVAIARTYGVSDAVIGLSLVAFGTSLPEFVAAIVSSLKRESEVVLGSVIGSNTFNILAILGVTVMIGPINIAERINSIDAPLVVATSLGMMLMLMLMQRIGRIAGAVMLALYGGYIVMLVSQSGI